MDLFFVMATAVVALLILYFVRPELSDEGSLLRRWSRDNSGDTGSVTDSIISDHILRFTREHSLSESESRLLQGMRTRPAMMPVTLLLHPGLV